MNFLAHAHLAAISKTSITGSILGDFVKGDVSKLPYSANIKQGVQLHRLVDTFTDSHDWVKELKSQLGQQRRYAGIVLDMIFDHQLAKDFSDYYHVPLVQFSQHVYQQLRHVDGPIPDRYQRLVSYMSANDWLNQYQDEDFVFRAMDGVGQRLSKPVVLSQSRDWFQRTNQLEQGFSDFYQELQDFTLMKAKQLDF